MTTYAQVASKQQELRVLCARKDTVVIADEIHHCGDGENKTWGPALEVAFGPAKRRLLLSGTPFRSDNYKIQFVHYEQAPGSVVEEEAVADYVYGYGRALSDGEIIRPIIFPTYDGYVCWDDGIEIKEEQLRNTHTRRQARALNTALDPKGDWIQEVLSNRPTITSLIERTVTPSRPHNSANLFVDGH